METTAFTAPSVEGTADFEGTVHLSVIEGGRTQPLLVIDRFDTWSGGGRVLYPCYATYPSCVAIDDADTAA